LQFDECHTYYYQIKGKSLNDNTNAVIKFIKQTAIEVGPAYGKRRMRVSLNNQGYMAFSRAYGDYIGLFHQYCSLMNVNVVTLII
jgi:hypothetical protein